MMTNRIITACSVLLLAVFFASCSTSVDIAKRQFNNGYYIHIASKKQVNAAAQDVIAANKKEAPAAITEVKGKPALVTEQESAVVVTDEAPAVTASIDHKPVISPKRELKEAISVVEFVAPEKSVVEPGKSTFLQKKISRKAERMFMRGDAPAILLILLCIFLPPIAVGIVADWGTKFWFDLLLTLLFYFPGMIYAFFVCFG